MATKLKDSTQARIEQLKGHLANEIAYCDKKLSRAKNDVRLLTARKTSAEEALNELVDKFPTPVEKEEV